MKSAADVSAPSTMLRMVPSPVASDVGGTHEDAFIGVNCPRSRKRVR
jgi:hypothetical protein